MINNKILLLLKIPPPITGATLMNQRIAKSLHIKESFDTRSVLLSYATDIQNFGVFSVNKLFLIIKYFSKLFNELLFWKPNLVYFQISMFGSAFMRDSFYVFLIKLFCKKVVLHLRVKGFENYIKGNVLRYMYYKLVFKNTHIIVLSELLKDEIINLFNIEPYIVNNGYTIETECIIRRENVVPAILFFSHLMESKGIKDYLQALLICVKKRQDFEALIAGQEADVTEKTLNELLRDYSLEGYVRFVGPKYGAEKKAILEYSDILVYPTHNDAFPGVIIDAMQYSLPIIATKEGSIPIIIDDNINGILVNKKSPEEIAVKLIYLINNFPLRENLGKKAREKYFEYYTLKHFEERLGTVINNILGCK